MTAEQRMQSSWIWQYCRRLRNKIQCNICSKIWYNTNLIRVKLHLFRAHQIFHDEDINYRNGLIWRYFTKERGYVSKCRICNKFLRDGYKVYALKQHLKCKHPLMIQEIRNEFEISWISGHFILHTSNDKLQCNFCNIMFNIFTTEPDRLAKHLLKHGINENTQESTEANNINIIIITNQSVTEESNASNFSSN